MEEQILLSFSQTSYSEQPLFQLLQLGVIQLSGWATKAFSCLWALCMLCSAHGEVLGFSEAVNAGFMVYEEEPSMLEVSVRFLFPPFCPTSLTDGRSIF